MVATIILVSHFYYIVLFYGVTGYINILLHAFDIEKPVTIFGRIIFGIAHGYYKCTILWTWVVVEVLACVAFGSVQDTKGCLAHRIESYCNMGRIRKMRPIYFENHLQFYAVFVLAGFIMYVKFSKTVNYMNEANISSYIIYHVIFA